MPYPLPPTLYLPGHHRLASPAAAARTTSSITGSPRPSNGLRLARLITGSPRPSNGLRLALPPHQAQVVYREAAAQPEDGDDDRQPHCYLRGGHRHDAEHHGRQRQVPRLGGWDHRLASPSAAARTASSITGSPRLRLRLALPAPSQARLASGCGSHYQLHHRLASPPAAARTTSSITGSPRLRLRLALPAHSGQDLAGDQLQLLEPPVERVEDDPVHAVVEGGDTRADALGHLVRGAEQVVGLPVLEVHAGVDGEVRDRRLRLLALAEHPDKVGVHAPDSRRIAPGLAREALHLVPVALHHLGRRRGVRHPGVGVLRDAPEHGVDVGHRLAVDLLRGLRAAADPDGRVRLLDGLGIDGQALEPIKLALVGDIVARPQRAYRLDRLVHARPALL